MVSTSSVVQAVDGADVLETGPKVVEKVDYCALESGLESEVEANGNNAAEESAAELPDAPAAKKLFFVRIPRPPVDNSSEKLKKLTDGFQAHVAKIKKINAKVQAKRDEVRELRRQMGQARSLKGESQPEYEEKLGRLKQLQELRNNYQSKISEIRTALKSLDCDSEEKLDAKIKELEARISHDQIELREEKAIVKQIAGLRSQRERIREYESQQGSMSGMEQECNKIKAVIKEMDEEFSILKGERGSAQKIISDIHAKLVIAEKGMKEVEEEQADAVRAKNEALEALDSARDSVNAGMKDYRENRKFSMQIRDMVAAGQLEEAFTLCEAQVDEWVGKLDTDKAFRTSYNTLWADQRRTAVAEILPQSCSATAPSDGKGAKGGKGGADKPKPVANGAEKAKALIASLMQEASKEAQVLQAQKSAARAAEVSRYPDEDADDADDEGVERTPGEILSAAVEAAAKKAQRKEPVQLVSNAAAKAAEVFGAKVELPVIQDVEFVLPVVNSGAEVELSKEQIREEQARKAKEAEDRKKRKAEQSEEKKVKAAERIKAAEVEAKLAAEEKKLAAEKKAAASVAAAAAKAAEAEAAKVEVEASAAAAAVSRGPSSRPSAVNNPFVKTTTVASAKRPASKGLGKQLKKFLQQNQTTAAVVATVLLVILILIMVSFM